MANINELRHAGHSTTARAWLTNPVRRVFFKIMAPYLVHQASEIDALREQQARDSGALQVLAARAGEMDALREQLAALQRQGGASEQVSGLADRVRALAFSIDGLRKDQLAVNHRLSGMEDDLDRMATTAAEMISAGAHAPSGGAMQTLAHKQAVALAGTALMLHDGAYGRFLLRHGDLISEAVIRGEYWDPHLKPVIERYGSADRCAIDAGAYLGFHSVYMARFFQTVYSFEPQLEMFRTLSANLLLNNCANVVAANAALYDVAGRMRLADAAVQEIAIPMDQGRLAYDLVGNAAALMFQLQSGEEASDETSVPCRTIDSLGLPNLGFIKIDTQGSDLHVLRGASETIRRCRPAIVAEFERELAAVHGTSLEDFHAFFDSVGYEVTVLENRGGDKQIDLLATPR